MPFWVKGNNKIHGCTFPFIVGNIQGMQKSNDFKSLGFVNLAILMTFSHIIMYARKHLRPINKI